MSQTAIFHDETVRLTAREVAKVIAESADAVDREARWPEENVRLLAEAGLLGLPAPRAAGGMGEGFLSIAIVAEELGRACGSTSLVYGMHCVAAKVIAVNATRRQTEQYIEPIARGEHVTTLSLSEPGTGVHLYLPQTTFRATDDHFVLNGTKGFVTSGGFADSYVLSVVAEGSDYDPGTFSCILLDGNGEGIEWDKPWQGFGMRGNSSRTMHLNDVRVPLENLLGKEGDETWYVFEVIAPYFIVAMSGTYLGIAQAALDETVHHLRNRSYRHSEAGPALEGSVPHQLGEMWTAIERSRRLLYHAAQLADQNDPNAQKALFACKAEVADSAVWVANEAMTLTGGASYAANSRLARHLRDSRAAHVMSPSTGLLKNWLGRALLGFPLLHSSESP